MRDVIKTKRLKFRLYTEADKDRFIKLMTHPEVMKFVGDGPLSEENSNNLWRKLTGEFYPQGKTTIWALFYGKEERYAGHASIRPRPEYPDDWEIGYILKKQEWGKGLATEAAIALVRYGFETLGLKTVYATVDDDNEDSIKVLKKAGLCFLRYDFDDDGRYSVYSLDRPSPRRR